MKRNDVPLLDQQLVLTEANMEWRDPPWKDEWPIIHLK